MSAQDIGYLCWRASQLQLERPDFLSRSEELLRREALSMLTREVNVHLIAIEVRWGWGSQALWKTRVR